MMLRLKWLGIALLTAGLGAGCNRDAADATTHPATTQAAEEAPSVKLDPVAIAKFRIVVKKVYAHMLEPTFSAPARVAFNGEAMANVGAPVAGRVQAVKARLGDVVKKDDELLTVVSNDLGEAQSDYLLKRTSADTATEAVEPTKAAHQRAKALYDKSEGISLGEVQKREAEWKAAEGAQKTAQEAFHASGRKLRLLGMSDAAIEQIGKSRNVEPQYVVRAPIGGRIIERNATVGQQAGPDKEPLFTIADATTLWVIADVPEARLKDVADGATVRVTATGLRGDAIEGTVAYIAPAIDPATRTVQVRISVKGDTPGLRPGMFAEAEFDLPAPADAEAVISLPEDAVQIIDGKPAVFVPDDEEPNTFQKRDVIVGKTVKGKVPILFGITPREKVVVSGAFVLKAELGKPAAD